MLKAVPYRYTTCDVERLVATVEQLQDALARRILAEWNKANADAGTPHEWPAGQEWHQLADTSHSIFRQMARAEAGLDRTPAFRQWLSSLTGQADRPDPMPPDLRDDSARLTWLETADPYAYLMLMYAWKHGNKLRDAIDRARGASETMGKRPLAESCRTCGHMHIGLEGSPCPVFDCACKHYTPLGPLPV